MVQEVCALDCEVATFARLQRSKVLVIEDSESDARLVAAQLHQTANGYSLEWATSLAAGQQRLTAGRFDVVLLDLNLPDSSGLDTFEVLHESYPNVPVILLTGMDNLELAVEAVRRGAQDYVPKSKSNGEILDRAIRYAVERTRRGVVERRLQHLQQEIVAARRIQQFLFPKMVPDLVGWDLAGDCRPTTAVGGDFLDIFPISEGRLGLVVADVSSHGFGPALIMTETRRLVRTLARAHADPADVLAVANRALLEDTPDDMFVTLFLAVLDIRTRALMYASAGHEGYLLKSSGKFTVLDNTGLPLGVCDDAEYSWMKLGELAAGDVLVLLTDGFQEAHVPNGNLFGIERTLAVVRRTRDQPARQILNNLFEAVLSYCHPEIPPDDLTALIVKVDG